MSGPDVRRVVDLDTALLIVGAARRYQQYKGLTAGQAFDYIAGQLDRLAQPAQVAEITADERAALAQFLAQPSKLDNPAGLQSLFDKL